jgi:SAM-dependent methyltransferase
MPIHATAVILVETDAMRGYHSASYGDAFADVYDEWYGDISDVGSTVQFIASLAGAGQGSGQGDGPAANVLELGVGTGRIAIPLAASGCSVTGIDSSTKMLDQLANNDPHRTVTGVLGDMIEDLPSGPFDVVLAAYNTIFNLLDADRQQACFTAVAERLEPGGSFVVEAFAPLANHATESNETGQTGSQLSVRSISADRVVLSASMHDPATNRADGQFIEITESGGVRLRPWSIRYADTAELDRFATQSGLQLHARWADFERTPFDDASERHVSVYRRCQEWEPAG